MKKILWKIRKEFKGDYKTGTLVSRVQVSYLIKQKIS